MLFSSALERPLLCWQFGLSHRYKAAGEVPQAFERRQTMTALGVFSLGLGGHHAVAGGASVKCW